MAPVPSPIPSENSTALPLYVCYFNQTEGLITATNCSLTASLPANDNAVSGWAIASIVISYLFFCIALGYYGFLFWEGFKVCWRWVTSWRAGRKPKSPSLESGLAQPVSSQPVTTQPPPEPEPEPGTPEYIKKSCNPDELLLWDQVTFPDKISSGFERIHLPEATIDTVKAFGVPLLNRRSEFDYGVLANNNIPGLLLHGPPGTGKTELVRALARYCKTRVLSISAGTIMAKYFGETERAVRTAFSLSRKLSPCILFIDEADSLLGKRIEGEERTYRNMLSQFLSDWDGFNTDRSKPLLVVLATNRPGDLDDAILRRAPKRIAVDIPTLKDRVEILKIHLQGEQLDSDVSIEGIARKTDKFSGSDLKNLCIDAAYACIFEDNAHRPTEAPDKAEDIDPRKDEIDFESGTLHGTDDRIGEIEDHSDSNIDIDDQEHGEDIPLLPLQSSTAPPSLSVTPPPSISADSATTLVSDPPRRILKARHFEKAIKNITPTAGSKIGMNINHIFESGRFEESSRSNTTTGRTISIPRSRVPF